MWLSWIQGREKSSGSSLSWSLLREQVDEHSSRPRRDQGTSVLCSSSNCDPEGSALLITYLYIVKARPKVRLTDMCITYTFYKTLATFM